MAVSQTHSEVWPQIQRIDQSLAAYPFDYFPRGRLVFFDPGRRWLLFLDSKLNRGTFVAHLMMKWGFGAGHLTVQSDAAYTSTARVGDPI